MSKRKSKLESIQLSKSHESILKNQYEKAKADLGSQVHTIYIDDDWQGHFNALQPLYRIHLLIEEAFSLPKTVDGTTAESNVDMADIYSVDVGQCKQKAYELFRSRIGEHFDLAFNRLAEECASEAIRLKQAGLAVGTKLPRAVKKQKALDRLRYGLRSPGRPQRSKTRRAESDVASIRGERLDKITHAVRAIIHPQKPRITRREVAMKLNISDPTLRTWLKDLGVDDWEDFWNSIIRNRKRK